MTQNPDPKHPFSAFLTKDPYEFMHSGSEKMHSLYSSWNEIAAHLFRSQQAYLQSMMQEWWSHSARYSWPYTDWTGAAAQRVQPEAPTSTVGSHTEIEKAMHPAHPSLVTTGKSLTQPKVRVRTTPKTVRKAAGKASSKGR